MNTDSTTTAVLTAVRRAVDETTPAGGAEAGLPKVLTAAPGPATPAPRDRVQGRGGRRPGGQRGPDAGAGRTGCWFPGEPGRGRCPCGHDRDGEPGRDEREPRGLVGAGRRGR